MIMVFIVAEVLNLQCTLNCRSEYLKSCALTFYVESVSHWGVAWYSQMPETNPAPEIPEYSWLWNPFLPTMCHWSYWSISCFVLRPTISCAFCALMDWYYWRKWVVKSPAFKIILCESQDQCNQCSIAHETLVWLALPLCNQDLIQDLQDSRVCIACDNLQVVSIVC